MKNIVNILMAVYIAFITCYPCNDKDICVEGVTTEDELAVSNHDDSQHGFDLCSPFCICSCCHSTINQPKFFSLVFDSLKIRDFNTVVMPYNIQAIFYSIWEPPKLS